MSITTGQLTAAITASATTIALSNISTSQAGLPAVGAIAITPGNPGQIDDEFMYFIAQPFAGTFIVRGRGSDGTLAVAHDVNAFVVVSNAPASDLPLPIQRMSTTLDPTNNTMVTIGQSQTIVIPNGNTVEYQIIAPAAATITIPAPGLNTNGTTLVFSSITAAAHVLSCTGLINDGSVTSPHNTITFLAGKGAAATLVAQNGVWTVQALQSATVS